MNFFRIYIGKASKRRQGFGEEAMRAVLEYAFINLHMERIALDHLKEDRIMQNLCAKLGFKTEGIMRHAGKRNGKYDDLCRESLLRAEYYDKIHIQ